MSNRTVRCAMTATTLAMVIAVAACQPDPAQMTKSPIDMVASGRLVVHGQDDNIYILDRGQQPKALTQDAHLPTSLDNTNILYSDPTWSRTGWLSYVRTTAEVGGTSEIRVIAQPPTEGGPLTILNSKQDSYIYGYWSPSECQTGHDCNQFAYLINDNEGVALHLASVTTEYSEAADDMILRRSAPFFYSWSPDGQYMLWFLELRALVIYDVVEDQVVGLPDSPGRFLAPAWSPTDDRLLIARNNGVSDRQLDESQITIIDDAQRIDIGDTSDNSIYFEWAPEGTRVAWTSGGDPLDPVTISQADGSHPSISTQVENVVAFFWSPDGRKLAVVALEPVGEDDMVDLDSPNALIFTWWAVDAETGLAVKLARFFPTPEQFDLFRNFDQYAQSHRVWSPDSRYIVFADLPERGSRSLPGTIRLIDTEHPTSKPIVLMEGRQAVFSFDE